MKTLSRYRTGVSLHGHTSYSRENLRFLYRLAERSLTLRLLLHRGEKQYRLKNGRALNLRNAWWTPPIGPLQAWNLERAQIQQLELSPLISLTDHDSIVAPLALRDLDECRDVPLSFEWTLLYAGAELHLGIHNLPTKIAAELTRTLIHSTQVSHAMDWRSLLQFVAAQRGALVVLNHPLWDEAEAGEHKHIHAVRQLLQTAGEFIHALEWNGLRSRKENLQVLGLARAWSKPVVSGGDRHTWEANSVLNLTNASGFAEFATEVRQGHSVMMLTGTYRQSRTLRMMRMIAEVLGSQPNHPDGWARWSDRVFYVRQKGSEPQSLTSLFEAGVPRTLQIVDIASKCMLTDCLPRVLGLTRMRREPLVVSELITT